MNKLIEAGYDEIRIVVLASGMIRGYCEMYFWACKSKKAQNQPETAPEKEEKEMNQPEPEKVTESTTEPQNSKSTHQVITRDQINSWNRLVNEIAGTKLWHRFSLQKEYKDGSRWIYLTHNASIRACYKEQTGERFFVKNTKALDSGKINVWLYWENCAGTESERWLLNDLARDFFGC
jgi:hypothetical protein